MNIELTKNQKKVKSTFGLNRGHSFGLGIIFGSAILLGLSFGIVLGVYKYKAIVWGVKTAGLNVGGLSAENASFAVENIWRKTNKEVILKFENKQWKLDGQQIDLKLNTLKTVENAWSIGRVGTLPEKVTGIYNGVTGKLDLPLVVEFDTSKLDTFVASIAAQIDDEPVEPQLLIQKSDKEKRVLVEKGKDGKVLEVNRLKERLTSMWQKAEFGEIDLSLTEVKMSLDDESAKQAVALGEKYLGKELIVRADEKNWKLNDEDLISLVSLTKTGFDDEKLREAVGEFAIGVDRQPQNAAFQFVNGRVVEFKPSLDGLKVDQEKVVMEISNQAERLTRESVTIEAFLTRSKPAITIDSVNDLGIRELLGKGESRYEHSIPNRIHNVGLTASRINGVIVPPGSVFSFNETVGDISRATGYKTAYVISGGRTVLGDGGGVCQVSTTLFRAALNTGLPIVERKAHAYRVGYYEQGFDPGFDSTVYSPTVDLKFENDTPGHILVQTINNPKTQELTIEIYGTSDGRKVSLSKATVWGTSPAPAPVYEDDPSMPLGTIKQVDWAASGAKTKFDYKVTRGDEVIQNETFYSTYRPWRAVFLRGTAI